MREDYFKGLILWSFLIGKILISFVLFTFTSNYLGTIQNEEAINIALLLVPLLSIHITAILKEIEIFKTSKSENKKNKKRKVKTNYVILFIILFIAYILSMIFIIIQYSGGDIKDFKGLSTSITFIETIIGTYLSIIIIGLLKKDEKNIK